MLYAGIGIMVVGDDNERTGVSIPKDAVLTIVGILNSRTLRVMSCYVTIVREGLISILTHVVVVIGAFMEISVQRS